MVFSPPQRKELQMLRYHQDDFRVVTDRNSLVVKLHQKAPPSPHSCHDFVRELASTLGVDAESIKLLRNEQKRRHGWLEFIWLELPVRLDSLEAEEKANGVIKDNARHFRADDRQKASRRPRKVERYVNHRHPLIEHL